MLHQTIGAIATAPGEAGVSVIRISGEEALAVWQQAFLPQNKKPIEKPKPRYFYLGHIVNPAGIRVDQVLSVYMPGPHSYTGEDVVEIHCHGGYVVTKEIFQTLLAYGVMVAEPGEFTQRAFLNGKLNLTQAEAIIDIIQAKSKAALQISQRQLGGVLGRQVAAAADQLLDILAQIEVAVDYPEEEGDIWENLQLHAKLTDILANISHLLEDAQQGKYYREGILTAIVGPANAGKSTLLNAFLEEERAIVTEIAGTTRDTIEEYYTIQGVPLRLVDTAGIRETADLVEAKGIERSMAALFNADLVLALFDCRQPIPAEWAEILLRVQKKPVILLGNKADLAGAESQAFLAAAKQRFPWALGKLISAKENQGLAELKQCMVECILGNQVQADQLPGLVNDRQKSALQRAAAQLQEALTAYAAGLDENFIAIDIQGAWQALGEITGSVCADDIITRVFSRFCLGK